MYWYISFLRPPPVAVSSTAEGITITPQVANDLRTELRYEPSTIHYKWQRLLPSPLAATPSQELTIFEPPMSTYKPLTIPLPPKTQVGERWRLGLFCPPAAENEQNVGCSSLLSLCNNDPNILGVWSEGVLISRPDIPGAGVVRGVNGKSGNKKEKEDSSGNSKGKNSGKGKGKEKDEGPKQGRITRDFRLPTATGNDTEKWLKIVEQTSFDLDKKIWDSGLALSAWLWRYLPSRPARTAPHDLAERVIHTLRREDELRVLEIGSGTGLVSIALALAVQTYMPQARRKITATDLGSAIPLMDENLGLNGLAARPTVYSAGSEFNNADPPMVALDAKVLDWDEALPAWVHEDWPEVIIAADVTYNTSAFPSLLSTLTNLLTPPLQSSQRPLLLLAYKQRDPAERDLWGMLKENGVDIVLVDTIKGAEEEGATEIWVGGVGAV